MKGGGIVILLLLVLAAFDASDNFAESRYSLVTGAVVTVDSRIVNVPVYTGWNMVGVNTLANLVSTSCSQNQLYRTIYAFFPRENKYGTYRLGNDYKSIGAAAEGVLAEESERLRQTYPETLSETRAVWLHNYGDKCDISANLHLQTRSFGIQSGWNMIAIQTDWQGKKMSEVMGSCQIPEKWAGIAGLFYNSLSGWAIMSSDTVLAPEHIGKGFWVNVGEECGFNEPVRDLAVVKIEHEPKNPEVGQQVNFKITVKNVGAAEIKGFTVKPKFECNNLLGNVPPAYEQKVILQPEGEYTFGIGTDVLSVREGEECEFSVRADAVGDVNENNNRLAVRLSVTKSRFSSGTKRMALLLVNYPDTPSDIPKEPLALQEAKEKISDVFGETLKRNSYDQLSVVGDIYGWHTTSLKGFDQNCVYRPTMTALQEMGSIDFGKYDLIIVLFNGCSRGGRADYTLPGFILAGKVLPAIISANIYPQDYVEGKLELDVIISELLEEYGHILGAAHSAWASCSGSKCEVFQRHELSSIMGNGAYAYNSFNKEIFGWLAGRIIAVEKDGTYNIAAIDIANPAYNFVVLKVPRGSDKGYFYVEYRGDIEKEIIKARFRYYDPKLEKTYPKYLSSYKDGLFIYLDRPRGYYDSYLVDTHINTELEQEIKPILSPTFPYELVDAPLKAGETFTDPESGVTIEYSWLAEGSGIATVRVTNVPQS